MAQAISKYNTERVVIIEKLIAAAKNDDDRAQWTRQMVDGLAAAVQTVGYKDGLKQLQAIRDQVQKSSQDQDLVAYVTYRTLLADYSSQLQSTQSEKAPRRANMVAETVGRLYQEVSQLRTIRRKRCLQLAVTQEFSGKVAESKKMVHEAGRKSWEVRSGNTWRWARYVE